MSNNFYTSVTQKGDNIIIRGYENGQPYQKKIKFEPSIYFKHTSPTEIKTANGDYLHACKYGSIKEARDALKTTKDVYGMESFGTDDWVRQAIREYFPETVKPDSSLIRAWYWDIETRVDGVALLPYDRIKVKTSDSEFEIDAIDLFTIDQPFTVFCPLAEKYVKLPQASFAARGFPSQDVADREILLLTFYDQTNDKITVFSRKPVTEGCRALTKFDSTVDFRSYQSEREMLKDVLMFFRTNRMDFLLGWNSNFDLGFVYNRIKHIFGESFAECISPLGFMKIRKKTMDNGEEVIYYEIPGIAAMDYLEMYQKFNPGSKESFKLDFIAEYEIGEKKLPLPGETFYDSYAGDYDIDSINDESTELEKKVYQRTLMRRSGDLASDEYVSLDKSIKQDHWDIFVEYNIIDVMLVKKIDDKQKLVDLCCMIAYDARINFSQTLSSMITWESIIYNYFVDKSIMLPVVPNRARSRAFPGAYVKHPITGKYGWTLSLDFTSLYPSIMIQNNISPDTKAGYIEGVSPESLLAGVIPKFDTDKFVLSPNGFLTRKGEMGYIAFLSKRTFEDRKKYKKHMLVCETEAQQIRDELTKRGISY